MSKKVTAYGACGCLNLEDLLRTQKQQQERSQQTPTTCHCRRLRSKFHFLALNNANELGCRFSWLLYSMAVVPLSIVELVQGVRSTPSCLTCSRNNMPATAGRVRMPANNRMST